MHSIKVFNLGGELDANSLYSDFPMSKRELSQILNCSRTSVHKWYDIAWKASADFRAEVEQDDEGIFAKDAPLTPYQAWFISRVKGMMERLRSSDRTVAYIKKEIGFFSKKRFDFVVNIIKEKTA